MALILSRREGETVRLMLGEVAVWVTVADIRTGRARLVIDAPREVQVDRAEILEDGPPPPSANGEAGS
jgi:carbon storage regulator CsrA